MAVLVKGASMSYRYNSYLQNGYVLENGYNQQNAGAPPESNGLLANLFGYYSCDDAGGTTLIDIHGTNDLSISDTWTSSVNAKLGTARQAGDVGIVASMSGNPYGPFSISAWYDPIGEGPTGEIIGVFGNVLYRARMISGTDIRLYAGDNSAIVAAAQLDYAHYVLTYDGNVTVKLYIDGSLAGTVTASAAMNANMTWRINSIEGADIDEVSIFTEELDLARVQLLYNGGTPLPYGSFS